ncbi:hypothetical protein SAMN04487839_10493 [Streptococcus gallolyticus]|uniref:Uncharacterized protein n=1 Tax=Streptococcus gallolyticus TaxID=315405 RepID=A0A1H7W8W2_9STRE|nr:hypothetical protein [Streptococcus gallolyticus]MCQ9216442.1 hypothetical protein [Streptococcus gallolyticus]SEF22881.1 hypothetical protein SAMN02910295_1544 [Streptococcus gallolyticus]SEM17519.1 hypothetical protein SAMN04487839_10493 [Streptococcus gallolyticus]
MAILNETVTLSNGIDIYKLRFGTWQSIQKILIFDDKVKAIEFSTGSDGVFR